MLSLLLDERPHNLTQHELEDVRLYLGRTRYSIDLICPVCQNMLGRCIQIHGAMLYGLLNVFQLGSDTGETLCHRGSKAKVRVFETVRWDREAGPTKRGNTLAEPSRIDSNGGLGVRLLDLFLHPLPREEQLLKGFHDVGNGRRLTLNPLDFFDDS